MATGGGVKEVGVRLKVGATGLENATALSRSLRDLGVDTTDLDKKAEALGAELSKLGAEQRLIDNFVKTKGASEAAAKALAEAQAEAQKLGREFGAIEAPTKAQTAALGRARTAVQQAKQAQTEHRLELQQARDALTKAGIGSDDLAAAQVRVKKQTDSARQGVEALTNQYRAAEGVAQLNATGQAKVAEAHGKAGTAAQKNAGQQAAAAKEVTSGMDGIAGRLESLGKLALGGVLGLGTTQFLRSVVETGDAFNNLKARMSLVTGEGPELAEALAEVEQIALRTGSSLETTGTLFTRVLTAGKDLGLAQADALKLTEAINQAVQISGASAQAGDAAITQLIQGLQSGVLRGEEFNSVMEQTPRLAQALADGLGVTRGELRGMAQDGQISAERVITALQGQSAALQAEFGKLPATVGRSIENLRTAWTVFIGGLDQSTGATAAVASGINAIAERMDDLAGVATRAGAVLVAAMAVQGAGALKALAAQALTTAGAMGVLSTSIEKVPKVVNITVAAVGLEVGYQIGQFLHENSVLARKLGIGLTEFFTGIVNDLQFAKEAATAIFTDDTVGQAFDRFKQRAEEQAAIFGDMYRDAEQAPEVVRAAAAAAEAELQRTGKSAETTGAQIARGGVTGAAGVGSIGQAAEDAASAIGTLVAQAKEKLPQAGLVASQQAAEMARLAEKSQLVAQRLAKDLPEAISKLSGAELGKFRDTMVLTLRDSEKAAGLLQTALVETGKRAAQVLGVDIAAASTTLTAAFVEAQENFAVLVRTLPELQKAGIDTGKVVSEALAKMADGAKNQAEFDALRARIEALGKAGTISKTQVVDLLDSIRKRADEATKGITSLEEAYKLFGITTKAELDKVAANSRQAWQLIRNDATASLEVKQRAFQRYATDAIAANGGVADSTLKAEAAALGVAIQVDKTGKAIVRAMDEGGKAVDGTKKKFNELGQEVNALGEVINSTAGAIVSSMTKAGDVFTAAGREARNAQVSANGIDSIGDHIRATPDGGITRTATVTTPYPAGAAPGDYEWVDQGYNRGGAWVLTQAASERMASEMWGAGRGPNANVQRFDPVTGRPLVSPAGQQPQASANGWATQGGFEIRFVIGGQAHSVAARTQADAERLVAQLQEAFRQAGGG